MFQRFRSLIDDVVEVTKETGAFYDSTCLPYTFNAFVRYRLQFLLKVMITCSLYSEKMNVKSKCTRSVLDIADINCLFAAVVFLRSSCLLTVATSLKSSEILFLACPRFLGVNVNFRDNN